MALSIKNDRADELAREIRAITGQSITDVVIESLEQRLQQLASRKSKEAELRELHAIADEFSAVVPRDADLSTDDLYDDIGAPK
jgi:antitoxin VapB